MLSVSKHGVIERIIQRAGVTFSKGGRHSRVQPVDDDLGAPETQHSEAARSAKAASEATTEATTELRQRLG